MKVGLIPLLIILYTILLFSSLTIVVDHISIKSLLVISTFSCILLALFTFVLKKYISTKITEEDIFKHTFSSMNEGVLILDKKNKIISINKAFRSIFEKDEKDITRKHIEEIFPEDIVSLIKSSMENPLNPLLLEKNDKYYELQSTKIYKKNKDIGTAIFIKDITESITSKREFTKEKEKAEAANKAKSAFLANISHEIRSPLTGILSIGDLLYHTPLTPIQKHYIEMLNSSAMLLYNLINDILDISKIEAGKIELEKEEINFKNLIYNILNITYLRASKKNLELMLYVDPEVPKYITGDRVRITQILLNLLTNAIKFTEKGYIKLKILKEKEDKEYIVLKFIVKDTGIGIPQEKIPLLFRKFVQTDASITRKFGGTGLGLFITKELIQLMGGDINVKSEVGKGSIFTFTIKVIPSPKKENFEEQIDHPIKHFRPLIISENRAMSEFLVEITRLWGIDARFIVDIEELETLDSRNYNLIILDVRIYSKKEEGLINKLKEHKNFKDVPFLALTPSYILDKITENKKIDDYIIKPLKQSDLYNKLINIEKGTIPKHQKESSYRKISEKEKIGDYKLLIVEDNETNQEVLKSLIELSRWKINIDIAENGIEALKKLEKNNYNYDFIFMDINMPKMGGIEATQKIREAERKIKKHIPIIALTASAFKEDRERFLSAGMDDYLAKPFTKEELYRKIKKFLPKKQEYKLEIESEPNPKKTKKVEVLDISELAKELNNDELLNTLVSTSLKMLENEIQVLEEAIRNQDINKIKEISHRLKGGISKFSNIIFNILEEIERLTDSKDFNQITRFFDILKRESKIYKEEVESFLDILPSKGDE